MNPLNQHLELTYVSCSQERRWPAAGATNLGNGVSEHSGDRVMDLCCVCSWKHNVAHITPHRKFVGKTEFICFKADVWWKVAPPPDRSPAMRRRCEPRPGPEDVGLSLDSVVRPLSGGVEGTLCTRAAILRGRRPANHVRGLAKLGTFGLEEKTAIVPTSLRLALAAPA